MVEAAVQAVNIKKVKICCFSCNMDFDSHMDTMRTLQIRPPAGFAERVVQAADRWRYLDHDKGMPCEKASGILDKLHCNELVWVFLTTPVSLKSNETAPWIALAQAERTAGDYDLADRVYRAAFESQPTDAQVLWDRAQHLQQWGREAEAQKLYRQLAHGKWQPRFRGLQEEAGWQLRLR